MNIVWEQKQVCLFTKEKDWAQIQKQIETCLETNVMQTKFAPVATTPSFQLQTLKQEAPSAPTVKQVKKLVQTKLKF